MSICALCALTVTGDRELCDHHHGGSHDDWAAGNRAMCDLLHRKQISRARLVVEPASSLPVLAAASCATLVEAD